MPDPLGKSVPLEQLLSEVEDVLRSAPSRNSIFQWTPESLAWRGRAAAVIGQWDRAQAISLDGFMAQIDHKIVGSFDVGYSGVMVTLHRARSDIRMRVTGPINTAIGKGEVFDYFDGLRKVIEPARKEVFFIDRYLNAEFVSKYLPLVHADAIVRLLTTEKSVPQLVPAIDAFCKQNALRVEIRTTNEVHDRHLIIDRVECYQSGASFKDGAKLSPTTLTQITDAFDAVRQTYESIWAKAVVVR